MVESTLVFLALALALAFATKYHQSMYYRAMLYLCGRSGRLQLTRGLPLSRGVLHSAGGIVNQRLERPRG